MLWMPDKTLGHDPQIDKLFKFLSSGEEMFRRGNERLGRSLFAQRGVGDDMLCILLYIENGQAMAGVIIENLTKLDDRDAVFMMLGTTGAWLVCRLC